MADRFYAGFDSFAYPGDQIMRSLWENTNLYWVGYYLNADHAWNCGKEKPDYDTLDGIGWGIVPIYIGYQNRFYARKVGIMSLQTNWKKEHPDETDMPEFTYQAHLDQIPRKLVSSEGEKDGNKAVDLAIKAKFPAESILYFDCESPDQDDVWLDYFLGWCNAVKGNQKRKYYLGLYTPPGLNSSFGLWLNGQLMSRWGVSLEDGMDLWVSAGRKGDTMPADANSFAEIDPTGCGLAQATSWQYSFGKTLEWVEDDPTKIGKTRKRVFNPADLNSSIYQDPGWGV
jgi:hypothetical protein